MGLLSVSGSDRAEDDVNGLQGPEHRAGLEHVTVRDHDTGAGFVGGGVPNDGADVVAPRNGALDDEAAGATGCTDDGNMHVTHLPDQVRALGEPLVDAADDTGNPLGVPLSAARSSSCQDTSALSRCSTCLNVIGSNPTR